MVVASFHLVRFSGADVARRLASVPIDRRRLAQTPGLRFGKLLGTGRGRTMTTSADLGRWAVFGVWEDEVALTRFRTAGFGGRWARAVERYDLTMEPIGARGRWDGVDPIAGATGDPGDGPIAVVTRATVRWRRLPAFLRSVPAVDRTLDETDGLLAAVGIGEIPIGRQATFSLWRDLEAMRDFARRQAQHAVVVERTRTEDWYGEEWFARFRPTASSGTWDGLDPQTGAPA